MMGNFELFNGFDENTRTTVNWVIGLMWLAFVICIVIGFSTDIVRFRRV